MSIIERLTELRKETEELRKTLKKDRNKILFELLNPLFEKHPEVEAISWYQYTPSFNDGDPCSFGSYHNYPKIKLRGGPDLDLLHVEDDEDYDDDYNDEDEAEFEELEPYTSSFGNALSEAFSDDDTEAMFGDGVEVFVSSTGEVTTDEYQSY